MHKISIVHFPPLWSFNDDVKKSISKQRMIAILTREGDGLHMNEDFVGKEASV